MKRGRRLQTRDAHARQRETLERRWAKRLTRTPALAPAVTAAERSDEPFHRWLHYKQAFAPRLVRTFLARAEGLRPDADAGLLDPFVGAGTVPIECARRDLPAAGVEASAGLAFLARTTASSEWPELPPIPPWTTWRDVAGVLEEPLHRAALMLAVARQHDSDGRPLGSPPPLENTFNDVQHMIRADLRRPLPRSVNVQEGDARRLETFADESVGGILTSPPYLSRHDYRRITRPLEQVHRFWQPAADPEEQRLIQVRAHARAHSRRWSQPMTPTVAECCEALSAAGQTKWAGVVRSYFEDLFEVLHECRRVLRPGCPLWIVIGGARLKSVYVPSDLILAEFAIQHAFDAAEVHVARELTPTGRRLGTLERVAPRESLLMLRRR